MDENGLSKMLYEHKFTDEENQEMEFIVKILRCEGFNHVYYNSPIYENGIYPDGSTRYSAGGDCCVCITAFQKAEEEGFDYYIIQVGDRGEFFITDFQEKWLPRFEARCQKEFGAQADPRNCLLYYLMRVKLDDDQRDNAETVTYVLYNGYCLRATIDEETEKYRLEPLVKNGKLYGCGSGFAVDEFMHQIGYSKPVFEHIECPSCHHDWMFNDSKIPIGEKYELKCPKCGAMLMRKRIK